MRNPPYTIFNMKTNILQEFSIWIGVPLNHISNSMGAQIYQGLVVLKCRSSGVAPAFNKT